MPQPERKLTYSTLAIALGLAGAGAAWSAASARFGVPPAIGEVLIAASGAWWLAVVVARAPTTPRRFRDLLADMRHPTTGPFPAYVPIVALLLTMHYAHYLPAVAARALCVLWVAMLALGAAQMLAFWLSGALRLEQLHPGYALPVIAGPYIAAMSLMAVGDRSAAIAAAGFGTFCWFVLGSVIFVRLIAANPMPEPMTPTLSVLVTPPVTAGMAWFALRNGEVDGVQQALVGVVVLLLLMQVFLIPTYLATPFGLSFWAFSFPASALATYSIRWAAAVPGLLTAVVSVVALTTASITLLALTVASVTTSVHARRRARSGR